MQKHTEGYCACIRFDGPRTLPEAQEIPSEPEASGTESPGAKPEEETERGDH